ncbi:MAG: hypothetical protein ACT4P9_17620 [Betaproteobacteria bacterium]
MRLLAALILLAGVGSVSAADPVRSKGLSAHFLPKRVAEADKSKTMKWGFVASTARTATLPAKDRPVLQSVADFIGYFTKLDADTQRNGIWVVMTNPAAYSPDESAMLEELKRHCKAKAIPLFVARGSELPNGWQRHSNLGIESRT